jgi:hypothetical protein
LITRCRSRWRQRTTPSILGFAAAAWGVSALASSGGELGLVDWLGIGVGLAAVAGPMLSVAKALASVGRGAKGLNVLREAAVLGAGAAGVAGAVAPATGTKPTKAGGVGIGRSMTTGLSALGVIDGVMNLDARVDAGAAANGGDRNAPLVQALKENAAATEASVAWLVPYHKAAQDWGRGALGLDKTATAPAARGPAGSPREAERQSMDKMKVQFGPLLDRDGGFGKQVTANDVLDLAGIDAALRTLTSTSAAAGEAFKTSLSVSVTPIVDTSSISSAAAAIAALKTAFAEIGTGIASGPVSSTPGSRLGAAGAQEVNKVDGHRASGGPIRRGMTYQINEKGQETITPGRNGYVTPAHKAGGGQNITIHIDARGAQRGAGEEIASALQRRLKRSSDNSLDGRLG